MQFSSLQSVSFGVLWALLVLSGSRTHLSAQSDPTKVTKPAIVTSLRTDDLADFEVQSEGIQKVIAAALALTKKGLTYSFGSSDPNSGGMDCSGTIYHLLQEHGMKDAPRQSDEICLWIKDNAELHLTPKATDLSAPCFGSLRPGDLVFWTGTYATAERKLPISHVMLYLGKLKANGRPVIFGASDGRRFAGKPQCGVSVFDFETPTPNGKSAIYGYGAIPGLSNEVIRKP